MSTIDTTGTSTSFDDAALQQKAKDHLWMHFSRQSVLEEPRACRSSSRARVTTSGTRTASGTSTGCPGSSS